MEKGDGDHQGGVPLEWRHGNQMDSFCHAAWDQASNPHSLNFFDSNVQRADVGWNPSLMEIASMAGHFALNQPFDIYTNVSRSVPHSQRNALGNGEGPSDAMAAGDHGIQDSGSMQGLGFSVNEFSDTKASSKDLAAKKRKMGAQEMEMDESKGDGGESAKDVAESKLKVENDSSTIAVVKPNGKHGKEKIDPPKEDYIHVRARRGQATNSHSLAERVRREKISERMKLLQDLVPGCSKVTGKAVMLDEIINYVQSLQRQVEFLSMKLAAINPQLSFNMEGILQKDILQSHAGPSSTTGFSPDMVHPLLHQNLQDLVHSGTFGMATPPDALRRAVNAQMAAMHSLKESKPQIPHVWEGELQTGMQMNFVGNQPLNIQDLNAKSRDGFPM